MCMKELLLRAYKNRLAIVVFIAVVLTTVVSTVVLFRTVVPFVMVFMRKTVVLTVVLRLHFECIYRPTLLC